MSNSKLTKIYEFDNHAFFIDKDKKMPKNHTIGFYLLILLSLDKYDDLEIINLIRLKFTDSKFNKSHLIWYKSQINNDKYFIPIKRKLRIKK